MGRAPTPVSVAGGDDRWAVVLEPEVRAGEVRLVSRLQRRARLLTSGEVWKALRQASRRASISKATKPRRSAKAYSKLCPTISTPRSFKTFDPRQKIPIGLGEKHVITPVSSFHELSRLQAGILAPERSLQQ